MNQDCSLISRRRFIGGLGASVGTVMAAGYAINVFNRGPAQATAPTMVDLPTATPPGTARTLVVVELGGGNDALNMVVPHGTDAYYDARPNIGIADPIDLNGQLGFHPELPNLASLYDQQNVAIVEGVGYQDSGLSHFVSMNAWWTGEANFASPTGWLGRYLDQSIGYTDPLAGISIGPGPSQAMVGAESFAVAITDQTGLQPGVADWVDSTDELVAAWAGIVPSTFEPGLIGDIHRVISATDLARHDVNDRLTGNGGRQSFTAQLAIAADLITNGRAPQVIYVHGRGDFDTHENQSNRHGDLMADLDEGIGAFFTAVEGHDVAMLTASEFGRRVSENGGGTDHGAAAAQILIGPSVTGGIYGEPPSITQPDRNGNLSPTVDFRSVYATVLDEYLGANAESILAGNYERLGVFEA